MDGADDFDFFYNDLDFDEDDSMEHVDDERDDCGRDLSDDEGAEKQDPIQLSNVRTAKARLEGTNILEKVKNILKCMKEEGLYFMSNLCIPSRLGQFGVKLMELCKLQFGIYFEHHSLASSAAKSHCSRPRIPYHKKATVAIFLSPTMAFSVLFTCVRYHKSAWPRLDPRRLQPHSSVLQCPSRR
ncbi:hypothetical protein B0H10DRAFT_1967328 [Mycena sp. CBHHK59/15]|nr:hypothetical protein B0H10DRAFT_1967328 [Mycena sp. CBHHK59/15]